MMKYLYPKLVKPTGVISATTKLKTHVEHVLSAVIGVRTLRGAISEL